MPEIHRIYITGGAGVGKTTLARKLAESTGFPQFELDWLLWGRDDTGERVLASDHVEIVSDLAAKPNWIADGMFVGFAQEIWQTADLIIFLDISLRNMLWRIFWRHVKAEIRGNNRHPGWLNLFRFMRITVDQYRSSEIGDIDGNDDKILTRAKRAAKARQQQHKILVVSGRPDIARILSVIEHN